MPYIGNIPQDITVSAKDEKPQTKPNLVKPLRRKTTNNSISGESVSKSPDSPQFAKNDENIKQNAMLQVKYPT
jgi:hypothetical protein